MNVIPVMDLMDGRVVHARAGERAHYAPLRGALSDSCEPLTVLHSLLRLHPFTRLYLADLDAIRGTGSHEAVVAQLSQAHPSLEIWLDAGFASPAAIHRYGRRCAFRPVIGSESLDAAWRPRQLDEWHPAAVLSLDFQDAAFRGPAALWEQPRWWPGDVILMTLARVGTGCGPAVEALAQLHARAPDLRLYAAGGVRTAADLEALRAVGVAGALVASALHNGALRAAELRAYG